MATQLKMKKRYKIHPGHNQNHSSSHSENYVHDDGIGTKWYSVVSRLFFHQVCPVMYSRSTHTEETKSMKHDVPSAVATNDGDSVSKTLSNCGRVQCFFGWSC